MRGAVDAVAVARDVSSSSPSKPTAVLDMMRYQRPNPDCLPLPNGISSGGSRKPPPPVHRSSKDEVAPAVATDSSRLAAYHASASLESKQRARAPQPPAPAAPSSSLATAIPSPAHDHGHHDTSDPSSSSYLGGAANCSADPAGRGGGGGAVLLQWGQNKRTRGRRDASAGATLPLRRQPGGKIQRRSPAPAKLMPSPSGPSYTGGSNLRVVSTLPARGSLPHHRSAEEHAGGKKAARAEKQKAEAAAAVIGLMVPDQKQLQQHQAAVDLHHQPKKLELPRIYTTLSRKEKEEDFLAIKGTKLPVRPKKRPKNVEKAVNFICPGTWLTDVTRNRYEVREKKCPKKQKQRGLKGMESVDSDSD